ncbi:MAG: hypothetical protein JWO36_2677 [Myxococcales bacterium]|nr:hypothetical protein [Myxococcales bacterium]
MNRLAIALVLVTACGAKAKPATTEGAGSGSGSAIYAKKVALSWGFQPNGATSFDVFLVATDETGKAVSYPLGTFLGVCSVVKPAEVMKALTGVHCANGTTGTELHAVVQADNVIVLKMNTNTGVTPDPMAREEATRFTVPPGSKIEGT